MHLIDSAASEVGPIPYLTTIVVSKSGPDQGLPGIGFANDGSIMKE